MVVLLITLRQVIALLAESCWSWIPWHNNYADKRLKYLMPDAKPGTSSSGNGISRCFAKNGKWYSCYETISTNNLGSLRYRISNGFLLKQEIKADGLRFHRAELSVNKRSIGDYLGEYQPSGRNVATFIRCLQRRIITERHYSSTK